MLLLYNWVYYLNYMGVHICTFFYQKSLLPENCLLLQIEYTGLYKQLLPRVKLYKAAKNRINILITDRNSK
jgi:hypothetical protein